MRRIATMSRFGKLVKLKSFMFKPLVWFHRQKDVDDFYACLNSWLPFLFGTSQQVNRDNSMAFIKHHPPKEIAMLTQNLVVTSTPSAIITDVTTKLTEGRVYILKTTTVHRGNWLMFFGKNKRLLQVQVKAVVAFFQSKMLMMIALWERFIKYNLWTLSFAISF